MSSAPSSSSHLFLATARQLKSVHGYRVLDCLIAACVDPWRPLRVRLEAQKLLIDNLPALELTPHCEVEAVSPERLASYDYAWLWPWPPPPPPGPAVELSVPPNRRWALCMSNEAERDALLHALRDAIDVSHGPGSPFVDWKFGATLGQGSFGTVRTATRRAGNGETAAVKIMSLGRAVKLSPPPDVASSDRFAYPGETGADASFLTGVGWRAAVEVKASVGDGTVLDARAFVLVPHDALK